MEIEGYGEILSSLDGALTADGTDATAWLNDYLAVSAGLIKLAEQRLRPEPKCWLRRVLGL